MTTSFNACCLVSLLTLCPLPVRAQSPNSSAPQRDPRYRACKEQWFANKAGATAACDVAETLNLLDLVERLQAISAAARCAKAGLDTLRTREEISERVLRASLEIDRVFAEIDDEIARIRETRDILQARVDRQTRLANGAGIITGTGIGLVGSALALKDSTARAGSWVAVGSGAASTVFSWLGFRQPRRICILILIDTRRSAVIILARWVAGRVHEISDISAGSESLRRRINGIHQQSLIWQRWTRSDRIV